MSMAGAVVVHTIVLAASASIQFTKPKQGVGKCCALCFPMRGMEGSCGLQDLLAHPSPAAIPSSAARSTPRATRTFPALCVTFGQPAHGCSFLRPRSCRRSSDCSSRQRALRPTAAGGTDAARAATAKRAGNLVRSSNSLVQLLAPPRAGRSVVEPVGVSSPLPNARLPGLQHSKLRFPRSRLLFPIRAIDERVGDGRSVGD